MKKTITLFLISLAPLLSKAQAYTPMNLDTTCFWIQRYHDYWAGTQAQGEVLQYVEKDTIIGQHKFHIIKGYCTDPYLPPASSSHYIYNCYNPKIIIREDTANRKIYRFYTNLGLETIWLDFNFFNVQDTVTCLDTSSNDPCLIVDSIKNASHYGLTSRTIFANWYSNGSPSFTPQTGLSKLIEGVGLNYNFPDERFGEWGIPWFTLEAFVKNGSVLYKESLYPIDSCYRKSRKLGCWPLAVNDKKINNENLKYSNNMLELKSENIHYSLSLISMSGKLIWRIENVGQNFSKDFSGLPTGVYVLSIQSEQGVENRKILIR